MRHSVSCIMRKSDTSRCQAFKMGSGKVELSFGGEGGEEKAGWRQHVLRGSLCAVKQHDQDKGHKLSCH